MSSASSRRGIRRVLAVWALGAALGTIAWFTMSPFLTYEQEQAISWLLTGMYVVAQTLWLLRARWKAEGRSS